MPEPVRPRRSLRRRLAAWMVLSTLASLAVFAIAAYAMVVIEERDEEAEIADRAAPESDDEIAADARDEMLLAMAIAAPLALAISVGGALVLARKALAPIDEVIAAAGAMTAAELDQRLPVPARDDELAALTGALNGLFARLEQGFAALGRYATEASHELRTPLAVMATELEVALRRPRTPEAWVATATTTLAELRRLTEVVEALLALARPSDATARARFSLDACVEDACASAAAQASAAGVTLTIAATAAIEIEGVEAMVAIAIGNLLGNAIRYTPAGGAVTVAIAREGAAAAITIDDTGPGVAPAERARIFEPFGRGAAGAGRDGTGLGLAIARRIARQHGGELTVDDAPGGGARFALRLATA
ncbi:MAG: HAMP domain-containing protein [Deltaproteobacteria bacterium]|nr:HAMP domain-containing protein [Deltaproteobacteria bacterium]